jgi:hypothetical protein
MNTKTITLREFARRVEMSLGEVKQVEASRTHRRFRRRARPASRRYGGVRQSIRDTDRKTRYRGSRSLDARAELGTVSI